MENALLVKNLSQIITCDDEADDGLGKIRNGAMLCRDHIQWIGPEDQVPSSETAGAEIIDGQGGVLTPGLVEPHTHFLYGGSREEDFINRISAAAADCDTPLGGGIITTVRETRRTPVEALFHIGIGRLDSFLGHGITTVEVKSGYGLTTADEIKMLQVMQDLDQKHPVNVIPTFMAAHALPPEYDQRRSTYIALITDEMIPLVAEHKLAAFCDVFCESGAFSDGESEKILRAASDHGIKPKIHAEQFSNSGGTAVAVATSACSVDHLDYITDDLIDMLSASHVVAVLTPGVNFYLGLTKWPPARRLIDRGVNVALSTDFSPGACMTENLQLIMTIACVQLSMRPDEVIHACTMNAARAVGMEHSIGSLTVGKCADAVIWDAESYEHIMYHFGRNHALTVIKDGSVVVNGGTPRCIAV